MRARQEKYTFVCCDETLEKFRLYREALLRRKRTAGIKLRNILKTKDLSLMSIEEFIECLVQTKPDCIVAENTKYGLAINWNSTEISLLGDLCCVIPTKAHDNGAWENPIVHTTPIDVILIYVPGPLLRSDHHDNETPDMDEVIIEGKFNREAYYRMIERRFLPGLLHTNTIAAQAGENLFVTLPGIGCGQFAGNFRSIIHTELQTALRRLLNEHGTKLMQVRGVWYDNYDKEQSEEQIHGINFLTRPLMKTGGLPQLCKPESYGAEYANCKLVSLVAWDHVSKPGNDYWLGKRKKDDGVKAAATATMPALTGKKGVYQGDRMVPRDAPDKTWSEYTGGTLLLKVVGHFSSYFYETSNTQQKAVAGVPLLKAEDQGVNQESAVKEPQERTPFKRSFFPETSPKNLSQPARPANLDDQQFDAIRYQIEQLTREYKSCWPYPNKELKKQKVAALSQLLIYADEMEIRLAINKLEKNNAVLYQAAISGSVSTRTRDLFRFLANMGIAAENKIVI